MEFLLHSHRHALTLFDNEEPFKTLWAEIRDTLESITDHDLAQYFERSRRSWKSLSDPINHLIKERLEMRGWRSESPIFADETFRPGDKGRFRLDFAKGPVSVEVAFNHGEAAAWNLLKPVLASELNHVMKAIQTEAGVIITATDELKRDGGFDGAVGTYEKYVEYLRPLNDVLSVPLLIVGLKPPKHIRIVHLKGEGRTIGHVEWVDI